MERETKRGQIFFLWQDHLGKKTKKERREKKSGQKIRKKRKKTLFSGYGPKKNSEGYPPVRSSLLGKNNSRWG